MIGLLVEYRFFAYQANRIVALQQLYHAHLDEVKKVLRRVRTTDEGCSDWQEDQDNGIFPNGARIFSSDDEESVLDDPFIVINRAPDYLKDSATSYFKEQQLDSLVRALNMQEWDDYTDAILLARKVEAAPVKKSNKKSSRRTASRSRSMRGVRMPRETIGIFSWPLMRSQFWLSSPFGPRKKVNGVWGFHYGIDMAAVRGTPVRAVATGVVKEARYASGYGNTIVIQHSPIYKTRYAHLDAIYVKNGQQVKKGDYIGDVGDTGFVRKTGSDASHLHFEVYENGKQMNPMYYLQS
jgi:murein DD-endopeptidase MepM/ murein hydrolase activator NlpD